MLLSGRLSRARPSTEPRCDRRRASRSGCAHDRSRSTRARTHNAGLRWRKFGTTRSLGHEVAIPRQNGRSADTLPYVSRAWRISRLRHVIQFASGSMRVSQSLESLRGIGIIPLPPCTVVSVRSRSVRPQGPGHSHRVVKLRPPANTAVRTPRAPRVPHRCDMSSALIALRGGRRVDRARRERLARCTLQGERIRA